ncbi:hypothetical protein T12_12686 [Trichinella patagoniensis]|uniref:Uncharacterized protein n=1 Tax=Trichinella patagoniensis TaxID=990121 RepID=A0A0V1AE34_9BILA|nr:hypothetical protein T12_12686 [Trichinella patagoniensis]
MQCLLQYLGKYAFMKRATRYSLKLQSIVQYFVVLEKSNFLHFRSISNKLKKIVSIRLRYT